MSENMKPVCCCQCGVEFHISNSLLEYRRKDGGTFYCPNGHAQHFRERTHVPKEEYESLRKENDTLMHRIEILEAQLAEKEEKMKGWKLPFFRGEDRE